MRTLLDTPTDNEIALLRAVADGYAAAGDRWPVWQYVARRVDDAAADSVQAIVDLPTWRHHYRYVADLPYGHPPRPDETVRLTAVGMFHAGHPVTNSLLAAFTAALGVAVSHQRTAEPMPTVAVPVVILGDQLTQQVVMTSGCSVTPDQVHELLRHEPATWNGLSNGDGWQWDVSQLNLHPYRSVVTGRDYLAALEYTVGEPPVPTSPTALDPMALPNALDHLGLAWRLVTGKRLVVLGQASPLAALTLPASNRAEFESRCSGLADVLNNFTTAVPADKSTRATSVKSLQGLKQELHDRLGTNSGRAEAAVKVLQNVVRVRVGQQHRGADVDAAKAHTALHLDSFGTNWAGVWDRIRSETTQALTTIREEISELIEDR